MVSAACFCLWNLMVLPSEGMKGASVAWNLMLNASVARSISSRSAGSRSCECLLRFSSMKRSTYLQ